MVLVCRLWLNNQKGEGESLFGSIDVVATMVSLTSLWLHGNRFIGSLPENIVDLVSLKELNLNGNDLVGVLPSSLGDMELDSLDLNNNRFMGPIPSFKALKVSFSNNDFYLNETGVACSFEVMVVLGFLGGLNYPSNLVDSWSGNSPCEGPWLGIKFNADGKVSMINLPRFNLSGGLSPSVANLDSLVEISLEGNHINCVVPSNWTSLMDLKLLDLSDNDISPPLPVFSNGLKPMVDGNSLLNGGGPQGPSSGKNNSSGGSGNNGDDMKGDSNSSSGDSVETKKSKRKSLVLIVAPTAGVAAAAFLLIPLYAYCFRRKKDGFQAPSSLVVHPRDLPDSDSAIKIAVVNNTNGSVSTLTGSGTGSRNSSAFGESHVIEAGNLVISVQVLRNVTKNFAPENELVCGGFRVVYKGELDDGTKIAVKRMEAGVITNKALDEFQAEIAVLSKVWHRNLVALIGYSMDNKTMLSQFPWTT